MAGNTPILDLYKKDPATDGADTFNVKTMMNDNWDKIDVAHGAHLNHNMPHMVNDLDNSKTYRWGLRIQDGKTQFIYEEVI
jgi:hypothetical protein